MIRQKVNIVKKYMMNTKFVKFECSTLKMATGKLKMPKEFIVFILKFEVIVIEYHWQMMSAGEIATIYVMIWQWKE